MYQMRCPISGNRNQNPHTAVIGGSSPASSYIFATSSAMRNMTAGLKKKLMIAYATFPKQIKDVTKQIENVVRIVF